MTQDLVEASDESSFSPVLQMTSVDEVMQCLLPLLEHLLASHNVTLRLDLRYTGWFQGDPDQLRQMFLNIAYNACEAMPEGGTFTMTSQLSDEMIQFECSVTGCEMSSDLQKGCFQPFVTEGSPTETGLDMANVKEVLDELHASIEVQSEAAQGMTLRILLPRMQREF